MVNRRVRGMASDAGAAVAWRQVDKQALEGAAGVCALALATVMAGTGHLDTMRLLRGEFTHHLPDRALERDPRCCAASCHRRQTTLKATSLQKTTA